MLIFVQIIRNIWPCNLLEIRAPDGKVIFSDELVLLSDTVVSRRCCGRVRVHRLGFGVHRRLEIKERLGAGDGGCGGSDDDSHLRRGRRAERGEIEADDDNSEGGGGVGGSGRGRGGGSNRGRLVRGSHRRCRRCRWGGGVWGGWRSRDDARFARRWRLGFPPIFKGWQGVVVRWMGFQRHKNRNDFWSKNYPHDG